MIFYIILLIATVAAAFQFRRGAAGPNWRENVRHIMGKNAEMPPPPDAPAVATVPPLTEEEAAKIARDFKRRYDRIYAGFDLTPRNPEDPDIMIKYREDFDRKDLLDKLQNPTTPLVEKLRILRDNNHITETPRGCKIWD